MLRHPTLALALFVLAGCETADHALIMPPLVVTPAEDSAPVEPPEPIAPPAQPTSAAGASAHPDPLPTAAAESIEVVRPMTRAGPRWGHERTRLTRKAAPAPAPASAIAPAAPTSAPATTR